MLATGNLVGLAVTCFVLIVVPGPSVLFVVGRALSLGRGPAVASVVGNALGVYVVGILVAVGLGNLVQRSETAFLAVKLVGGIYLVWLGIQAIRHRHELATPAETLVGRTSKWHAARQGFVVGFANPKALIMFGAVLPQFVSRDSGNVPGQMILLSLIPVGIALVSDSAWAVAASGVRSWFAREPRRLSLVGGAGGLAMIGVGVNVVVTGRHD